VDDIALDQARMIEKVNGIDLLLSPKRNYQTQESSRLTSLDGKKRVSVTDMKYGEPDAQSEALKHTQGTLEQASNDQAAQEAMSSFIETSKDQPTQTA